MPATFGEPMSGHISASDAVQSTVQVPGAVSQLYNISNRAPTAASFMDGSDVAGPPRGAGHAGG